VRHHEAQHGVFPSGGWGFLWIGDPDRAAGPEQPGGWVYQVLPFVEQVPLHQRGSDGNPAVQTPGQLEAGSALAATPLPLMNCPSRRSAGAWPVQPIHGWADPHGTLGGLRLNARTDYAACAGDPLLPHDFSGPPTLAIAGQWTTADSWRANLQFPYSADPGGVCFIRSRITAAAIRGGLSNTYLVGEKYLNPDDYFTGRDSGDNQSMYSGYNHDHYRSVRLGYKPLRDQTGRRAPENFGSAHPAGFTMAFSDGAVRHLGYDIDAEVHRGLGLRNSAAVIEGY
jgi:hypothetical protein